MCKVVRRFFLYSPGVATEPQIQQKKREASGRQSRGTQDVVISASLWVYCLGVNMYTIAVAVLQGVGKETG